MKRVTVDIKMRLILDVKDDQDMNNISESITFTEIDTENDIDIIAFKIIDNKTLKTYELE
jgi:hypothetical protein